MLKETYLIKRCREGYVYYVFDNAVSLWAFIDAYSEFNFSKGGFLMNVNTSSMEYPNSIRFDD